MPSDASDWSNRPAFRLAQDQISLVSAAELAAQLKAWQISLDTQVWLGEHSATVAELNRMLRAGAGVVNWGRRIGSVRPHSAPQTPILWNIR